MPRYIGLLRWTQKGIEHLKDSPTRLEAAKSAFADVGAEIKEFYMVMGRYDMVVITEAPDEETAVKATLAIGSRGFVRTETMRAYTEEEYRRLMDQLP